MAQTAKSLAQSRPSDTTTTQVYSPSAGITALVRSIMLCNSTGTAATASVYIDVNGSTYDADSIVISVKNVPANDYILVNIDQPGIVMDDSDGNIAVKQGTGGSICFTISGIEI